MKVNVGVATDVGRVREGNEDAYILEDPLFGVADGMGGHLAGDVASSTAVDSIVEGAREDSPVDTRSLAALVRKANVAIFERAGSDPTLRGMGTTCTILLFDDAKAYLAHVGDSRAYLFRDGRLEQITEDHTLVNRMVSEGRIEPAEAAHHPQRSILTRALGVDPSVDVDTVTVEVEEGDRLLICSDGLSSMVENSTISEVLSSEDDPQVAADRLIGLANEAGGEDNITVVLLDVVSDSASAPASADTVSEAPAQEPAEAPPPPPPPESGEAAAPRRKWARRAVTAGVVIAVIVAGAYIAARAALSNSYFVGATEQGQVAIYSGIPEEVAGLSLRDEEEASGIALSDLPKFKQSDVREGIKADSLEDARAVVASLEDLARDPDFGTDRKPESKQ